MRLIWRDLGHFVAYGFGAGCVPWAPGTWGTLMAVPFTLLLLKLTPWLYSLWLFVALIMGIYVCGRAARVLQLSDPAGVVWDEMFGFWVTMTGLSADNWIILVLGFVLFRVFDIVKPWPISWCDKHIKGGLGIMIDDLLAGLFAAALLNLGLAFIN